MTLVATAAEKLNNLLNLWSKLDSENQFSEAIAAVRDKPLELVMYFLGQNKVILRHLDAEKQIEDIIDLAAASGYETEARALYGLLESKGQVELFWSYFHFFATLAQHC